MTDVVTSPYGDFPKLWHSVLTTLPLPVSLLLSVEVLRQFLLISTSSTVPRLVLVDPRNLLIGLDSSLSRLCNPIRLHLKQLVVGGKLRAPMDVNVHGC